MRFSSESRGLTSLFRCGGLVAFLFGVSRASFLHLRMRPLAFSSESRGLASLICGRSPLGFSSESRRLASVISEQAPLHATSGSCLLASLICGRAPFCAISKPRLFACSLPQFEHERLCVPFRSLVSLPAHFHNLRTGAFTCLFEVMSVCLLASLIRGRAPSHAFSKSRQFACSLP